MHDFTRLFRLLEITRSHPQYGYTLAEIPKHELSDLAQHHYLVSMMAWTISRHLLQAGCKINLERVLEIALIHDLGELFGGDISMPYAQANPKAYTLAKAFEQENLRYFCSFFPQDEEYVKALIEETFAEESTESLLVKIADYLEVTHYKLYVRRFSAGDIALSLEKAKKKVSKLAEPKARKMLTEFLESWADDLAHPTEELFEAFKKKA